MRYLAWLLAFAAVLPAAADRLDEIAQRGEIRLGVRSEAPPFSFAGPDGKPAGWSVELCERIAAAVAEAAGAPIRTVYVPVTGANRFAAVMEGRADLLCEATTATLSRREEMDFTVLTFGTVITFATTPKLAATLQQRAPRTVGVLAGTTSAALVANRPGTRVVTVPDHLSGMRALRNSEIEAYVGDRAILMGLTATAGPGAGLMIAETSFGVEPYAIALPRGESRLRLLADRTLSRFYRGEELKIALTRWFGAATAEDPAMVTLYMLQALPE